MRTTPTRRPPAAQAASNVVGTYTEPGGLGDDSGTVGPGGECAESLGGCRRSARVEVELGGAWGGGHPGVEADAGGIGAVGTIDGIRIGGTSGGSLGRLEIDGAAASSRAIFVSAALLELIAASTDAADAKPASAASSVAVAHCEEDIAKLGIQGEGGCSG